MKIICVGKLKEEYLRKAVCEMTARINKKTRLDIVELKDEKLPERLTEAEKAAVKLTEGARILKNIHDKDFAAALAVDGRLISSYDFKNYVRHSAGNASTDGTLVFIIGGTLGLSDAVLCRANVSLSFSRMTFPHQLMRVILLEQLSRAVGGLL